MPNIPNIRTVISSDVILPSDHNDLKTAVDTINTFVSDGLPTLGGTNTFTSTVNFAGPSGSLILSKAFRLTPESLAGTLTPNSFEFDGSNLYLTNSSSVRAKLVLANTSVFSVKDYGAKGDNTTDDTAAFNAAIVACNAAGGGEVHIGAGTYKLTGQVVLLDKVTLVGAGRDATTLEMSTSTATAAHIVADGSLTVLANQFTSNISAGSRAIRFSANPSVSIGDVLVIYNAADYSFSSAREYYRAGEFVRAARCAGSITNGSNQMVNVTHHSTLQVGDSITGTGIPDGTTITAVSTFTQTLTMSANATSTLEQTEITVPNVVFLEQPTYGAYTAESTSSIYKMNPVKVSVRDLAARFKTTLTGIRVTYGSCISMSNLKLENSTVSHITLLKSYEVNITEVYVNDNNTGAAGNNYGITIGNSQKVKVSQCFLSAPRHGITTGGNNTTGAVPCRDISIQNNTIATKGLVFALDLHGNSEFVFIRNNELLGGVSLAGDHVDLTDNYIRSIKDAGTAVNFSEMLGPNFNISGNRIFSVGNAGQFSTGSTISIGANNIAWQSVTRDGILRISDNYIDFGSYSTQGIWSDNIYVDTDITIDISGNTFRATGDITPTNRFAIQIRGNGTHGYRSVIVKNNQLECCNIRIDETASSIIHIENNTVDRSVTSGAIVLTGHATAYHANQVEQTIIVRNNVVTKPSRGGIVLIGDYDGSKTTMIVEGNTCINTNQNGTSGANSTDSSFFLRYATLVSLKNNTMGKSPTDGGDQAETFAALNIGTLYESNNLNIGELLPSLSNVSNRLSNQPYNGTLKELYGTAAPTSGTWKVGDRVWNILPETGGNMGWVCVTAGTSGTWKPFGIIGN